MIIETQYYVEDRFERRYEFEYHQNEEGVWYNTEQLYYILTEELNAARGKKFFSKFSNENEIKIFNVRYEDNRVCFIHSLAAHRLLVQNEIRCKQLRSSLVSLEKELGIINNEDSYNHGLKVALDQMEIIINSSDNIPKNLKSCAKVILESTPVQNIRNNNDYDVDQLKEEIIEQTDDQRQELIDAYDEGRLIEYKIRPKEESDGMLLYKKHPKYHKESTCPSWLRSIVK